MIFGETWGLGLTGRGAGVAVAAAFAFGPTVGAVAGAALGAADAAAVVVGAALAALELEGAAEGVADGVAEAVASAGRVDALGASVCAAGAVMIVGGDESTGGGTSSASVWPVETGDVSASGVVSFRCASFGAATVITAASAISPRTTSRIRSVFGLRFGDFGSRIERGGSEIGAASATARPDDGPCERAFDDPGPDFRPGGTDRGEDVGPLGGVDAEVLDAAALGLEPGLEGEAPGGGTLRWAFWVACLRAAREGFLLILYGVG